MITLQQIQRLVAVGALERLLDRVLANGRSTSPAIRAHLVASVAIEPVALSLGLQRACELAYGPQPMHATLAHRLMMLQSPSGVFVSSSVRPDHPSADEAAAARGDTSSVTEGTDVDVASAAGPSRLDGCSGGALGGSAVVVRALRMYQELRDHVGCPADPRVDEAMDRVLAAFSASQGLGGGIAEDPVENAIIMWQLGADPDFRRAIHWDAFRKSVMSGIGDCDVRRMAQIAA